MTTRIARVGIVFSVVVYFFSTLTALALPALLASGRAYASGEQYTFYYDPKDASSIEQGFSSNPLGTGGFEDNFDKTTVYAKGGSFGDTPVPFTYDQAASSLSGGGGLGNSGLGAEGSDLLQYDSTQSLSCSVTKIPPQLAAAAADNTGGAGSFEPYTLTIPLTMTVPVTKADIASNKAVSGTLSVDTDNIQQSIASNLVGFEGTLFAIQTYQGDNNDLNDNTGLGASAGPLALVPQSCLPAGLSISNNTGTANLQNYAALSKSAQQSWPGLQSSLNLIASSIPSPAPAPSPSTPSLGCSLGLSFSLSGVVNFLNPLNWLFCGITEGLVGVVGWVDTQINTQLAIGTSSSASDQPNTIFAGSSGCAAGGSCADYYMVWQNFRDIALGLLAIAGLIMVMAQALGMELLDAYTIRKVLPRLLIAAVGITLSWQLMDFLITLSNDLGYGVRNLISAPFSDLHAVLHLNPGQSAGVGILSGIGLGIAGLFGLMTLAGTAALALLVAYIVIVLRQVIVILLAILSPIAFVAYILPNTQRVYRLWWDTFSKALLMFPLISALITTGAVFSAVAIKQGGGDLQYEVIGFVAYFAPFFMIPLTFRLSGAALSGLGNFVNSQAQPLRGVMRQKRNQHMLDNLNKARDNDRFHKDYGKFDKKDTKVGRAYNRAQRAIGRNGQLEGSLGRIGNRAMAWGTDADQLIPYHLGKERDTAFGRKLPGGRVFRGVIGTKRYSPALSGRIANATLEQTTKRAQSIAGMHYMGQRGLAGDYEYLSPETQERLEASGFGTIARDATGNRIETTNRLGEKSYKWDSKVFHDGSLDHTRKMSSVLMQSSKGKERTGGKEMWDHRGDIATFSDPAEFRFADLQSGALMNLAQAGRAEQLDVNANDLSGRLGDVAGSRIYKTLADTGSRIRPEQRHGYGVIAEPQADGTVKYVDAFSDEIDPHTGRPYYEGETAKTSISSAGYHAWSQAKGESVRRAAPTFIHQLREPRGPEVNGHKTWDEEQQGFLNQIYTGRSSYGGDPGMQREWNKMANELQQRLSAQGVQTPYQLAEMKQERPGAGELSEADVDAAQRARDAEQANQ